MIFAPRKSAHRGVKMPLLQWSGIPMPNVYGKPFKQVASLQTFGLLGNLP